MRRSATTNSLILLGILAVFVVFGVAAWLTWDAAAGSEEISMVSSNAAPWAMVTVGGPVLLLVAIIWAKLRTRKVDRNADPGTPSDDPSKGMSGHD